MSEDILPQLGPLARLTGAWEGDAGVDVAPAPAGAARTRFREHICFEPFGPVANGPQTLFGLRYSTVAWPLGESEPFHEETGYWLWDGDRKLVMRCFMVPRGVTVLAGGKASPNAAELRMSAACGSETFGILSNPFLDKAFKTIRYDLTVRISTADTFSYEEDTQLRLPGRETLFHHTDANILKRVG